MAYLTIDEMRYKIASAYPDSRSWKRKVELMPNYQVFAIYQSFVENGKFDKVHVVKEQSNKSSDESCCDASNHEEKQKPSWVDPTYIDDQGSTQITFSELM